MRVLHVYSGNLYGGIEAILATIARVEARREPHAREPRVHEFALCFDGRLSAELRAAGARVHALPAVRVSRPRTAHESRRALRHLLAQRSFDRVICHAPWSMAVFGGIVRGAGVPLVFWAHDVMTGRHWTERLARRHELDLLVANSAFTLNAAATVYPRASSVAIYAPVDPPVAGPSDARRAVRRSLDTPESAVVIVQASRSEAWKGHLQLVAALAAIRDLPNWIWWQVGGAQRPAERTFLSEVRAAADRAGIGDRVRWLGERTDVPALLAAADLYCQANVRPEPFGVSFVEALAAGVPVVATDAGGAREIIDDSCGVLVAAEPEPIAGALRRLVADDRERARLASGARARAAALCDPERQISALHAALANIADALPRASRGKLTGAAAC